MSKEKDKGKKKRDKELIDLSMKLSPPIRTKFLYEWLKMCKAKHQLAFFQWRDRYCPTANQEELKECFNTQVEFARENNMRLNQMILEANE